MASASSSSRPSPPPRPLFTCIQEHENEEEDSENDTQSEKSPTPKPTPTKEKPYVHHPTPLPCPSSTSSSTSTKKPKSVVSSVLLNNCRPSSRDKISIVPLDINSKQSPNVLHSLFLSLTRKSPKPSTTSTSTSEQPKEPKEDEHWRLASIELSKKLLQATRKRDEALVEASRLKYSMQLQSFPNESFLSAVSSSRSAVHHFSRSLSLHLRHWNGSRLIHLEALLNRVFYEDFEKVSEEEARILNPLVRCESNRSAYMNIRGLTWEEVLSKGTRHYSEGLSRFCDKKMSQVVGMLECAKPWPEVLLQAFFGAAKVVWMVFLLARCVHPAVPILRVERGVGFDKEYMEDVVVGERVRRLTPVNVRMMVAPGFYVYSSGCSVVKCKVLCVYNNNNNNISNKVGV